MDTLSTTELRQLLLLLTAENNHVFLNGILDSWHRLNLWVGEQRRDFEFTAITGFEIEGSYNYFKASESVSTSELSINFDFRGAMPTHIELTIYHALRRYYHKCVSSTGKFEDVDGDITSFKPTVDVLHPDFKNPLVQE